MTPTPITDEENAAPPKPKRRLARRFAIGLAGVVATLATLAGMGVLVLDAMDIELFSQTGHAMIPSLPDGTRFVRVPFRDGQKPRRGQLVLVRDAFGSGQIVRRVIAVAGDSVTMDGFSAKVNGRAIGARAACPSRLRHMVCVRERLGATTWLAVWGARARPYGEGAHPMRSVPRDYVYVLADHRDVARDSRDPLFGALPTHAVLGYVEPIR